MPFLPNNIEDRRNMLAAVGVSSTAELFADVPAAYRFPELKLPKAASEMEILDELNRLAAKNNAVGPYANFLGAGAYHHFVPSVIPFLTGRSEFSTAYTPYQPEVSQGTLQAIFEYQSLMAELLGMEVVNASHYDGATAMAEAAIMGGQRFQWQTDQSGVISLNSSPLSPDITHVFARKKYSDQRR